MCSSDLESIDAIQQQGKDLDVRLKDRESRLRIQFALMEGSISRIKSASAGIATLASLPVYSSSSR